MPRKARLQKLTLFLLKEGLAREDALRNHDALSSHRVPTLHADQDALFVEAKPPHAPPWAAFLAPHVSGDLPTLVTASSAGVLLVDVSGRLCAVTFGQGRHLLDPEAYEQDFGLKVVLNTVAPDQLKSVDAKTIDETTLHTRRDVSRDSSFAAFGLDVSRDLLRAVTGTPQDETLAQRLTGADALGLWTRAQVPDLPPLVSRLIDAYGSEAYKEHFDFVDFLRPEKRPGRLRELEQTLVDALNLRAIDDAHLAVPEALDWIDVEGLRFSTQHTDLEPDSDPRISVYLDTREDEEINLERLKSDKMIALRASDGQVLRQWSIYRCLVYEVILEGDLYVLSAGDCFRVSLDFKQRVYADANAIPRLGGLPPADAGTDEDAYNQKAAAAIGGLCLDKKLVYDDGPDKMEICDVLTRDRGLIHVKLRGSSSTLSHLFTQGVNSAERLLQDQDFRTKAREVVEAENPAFTDLLPAIRPNDPRDYEVTFAVITRSKRATPLTLPFFSVVSLRAAASRLRAFGFRVSVAEIHEES
jgi:uncharacterized protein (TIGR04141 family)